MVKIKTIGREDLENLWKNSNILSHFKREHYPFLVFVQKEDEIEVVIYKELNNLICANLPETTRIMIQWGGNWRSDFFHFSLKELINAYNEKYPIIENTEMEKYYELYHKETGKNALWGGSETKIFQQWFYSKRELEALNKEKGCE